MKPKKRVLNILAKTIAALFPLLILSCVTTRETSLHPVPTDPEYQKYAYRTQWDGVTPVTPGYALADAALVAAATAVTANKDSSRRGPASNDRVLFGNCLTALHDGSKTELPCAPTTVILDDLQGNELAETRTDPQGRFAFVVDTRALYQIEVRPTRLHVRLDPAPPVKPDLPLTLHITDSGE